MAVVVYYDLPTENMEADSIYSHVFVGVVAIDTVGLELATSTL